MKQPFQKLFHPFCAADYLVLAAISLLMAIFFIYPLFLSVQAAFLYEGRVSGYWLYRALTNPFIIRHLVNSSQISFWTLIGTIGIGLPLSLLLARREFVGKSLWFGLLMLPLILPPFVGALSVRRLLGRFGLLTILLDHLGLIDISTQLPPDWSGGGMIAVVLMQILHLFPIMTLTLLSTLSAIDPAYVQAGSVFGADRLARLRYILLPLLKPGLLAGGTLVFVWSFTDIGTPLVVGYQETAAALIFKELARAEMSGRTFGVVLVVLFICLMGYALGKQMTGAVQMNVSAKTPSQPVIKKLHLVWTMTVWSCFLALLIIALLPHIGVIIMAFADRWVGTLLPERWTVAHFRFILTQPETRQSILNSLKYASAATVSCVLLGLVASWLTVRKKPMGWQLLDLMLTAPIAVPGIILASGYLVMTRPESIWSKIGPFANPFGILVIAYAVRRLPYALRTLSAGLEQTPIQLEWAARSMGCRPAAVFFRITMPLILPQIVAASIMIFAFSMLEVSDSLMLAQLRQHYPLTKEIYSQALSANPDAPYIASALGVLGMALLGSSMILSGALMRKKLGQLFSAS